LDEQALMRDCLARLLEAAGFVLVGQHSDTHGFLTGLNTEKPTVALLELSLGAGDGLTVLEEAHQLQPDVRLLVLSATLDPDVMDRCFRAGAAGYLDKSSARLDALIDAINAVARGNNVFPAHAVESLLRAPSRRNEASSQLRGLSEREREVLAYLAVGSDNLAIAATLKISERTVKAHVSNLYRKLGQDNRTQLALLARQSGVKPPAQLARQVPGESRGP
jgi:two-component system, NarL family, nitrate/nitrite response regulator NarL